ncbi:type II toxin-antitoxin system RelE/ParE family toxin [Jeotgalicoccus psychrophilus]|uniref:type II toxin-antitoxin system RelE/ParE family toxin n=1 Tax=Jeotgalicoccus psychrophilus TaxID=157228 RepID=UPI001FE1E9E4|nr:type II toxin-antitoxin system RelE/ParE family toxin [Jeotgalicoccus psychrophilus]
MKKKLDKNLYEIRCQFSNNIQRAVYFHMEDNQYVMTHGFTKKTQRTPPNEIKKAKRLRRRYLGREYECLEWMKSKQKL